MYFRISCTICRVYSTQVYSSLVTVFHYINSAILWAIRQAFFDNAVLATVLIVAVAAVVAVVAVAVVGAAQLSTTGDRVAPCCCHVNEFSAFDRAVIVP